MPAMGLGSLVFGIAVISLFCFFGSSGDENEAPPPTSDESAPRGLPSQTKEAEGTVGVVERRRRPYTATTIKPSGESTPTTPVSSSPVLARQPQPYAYTPASERRSYMATTAKPSESTPPAPVSPSPALSRQPQPYAYTSPSLVNNRDTRGNAPPITPPPSPPPSTASHIPRPYAYIPEKVSPSKEAPLASLKEQRPTQTHGATPLSPVAVSDRERRPYQPAFPPKAAPGGVHAASTLPTPPPSPGSLSHDPEDDAERCDLEYAEDLRAQANQMKSDVGRCKEQAQALPDGVEKRKLLHKVGEMRKKIELFDGEASRVIFAQKNKTSKKNVVDLHGLYTREALRGLHSTSGQAKIKPAVIDYLRKRKLRFVNVRRNEGSIIVKLRPKATSKGD
ncbi:hypothetical protein OF83DRAFT_36181 [Amylostereum chailletii]|nr:hypothetical protein OF83DRAFT_36181 [Amylostereum chailletii]